MRKEQIITTTNNNQMEEKGMKQEIQRLKAQGLSIPEIKALLETKGFHPEEF